MYWYTLMEFTIYISMWVKFSLIYKHYYMSTKIINCAIGLFLYMYMYMYVHVQLVIAIKMNTFLLYGCAY